MKWAAWVILLSCASVAAVAQTTQPAAVGDDPYQNLPVPTRRNAATQSTAGGTSASAPVDPFDTKRQAIALGIVIVAMFVSFRVWKRLGMPGAGNRANGALQVVSRVSISPKQQLLLVRVGRRLVLVGNSGVQMNALCEIADPEEAAVMLGQVAAAAPDSASSFGAVLGGEERQYEVEQQAAAPDPAEDDPALANTREELSGMLDKVRDLSKQFQRA